MNNNLQDRLLKHVLNACLQPNEDSQVKNIGTTLTCPPELNPFYLWLG